ncbi:MAG: adenylate kinase [Dehalococcoidia bacterium]
MYVILFGAPGSGKGTQASRIAQKVGLAHIATGDIFRQAVQRGTELGKLAQSYMDKGQLVPDDVTIRMLIERLDGLGGASGYMLDGFPRTLAQARALDEALARREVAVDKILYIKVSNEELLRRLSGRWTCRQCGAVYHQIYQPPQEPGRCDRCGGQLYQRDDDQPATAHQRLGVYFQQTAPVLEYYRQQGKLVEVDGEPAIEDVGRSLLAALGVPSPR